MAGAIQETEPELVPAIAMFGDSTALMTGTGVARWAQENPGRLWVVRGDATLGCGLISGGTRILEGREFAVDADCDDWLGSWLRALDSHQPSYPDGSPRRLDVAMVQLGAWEIVDHRLGGGDFLSLMDLGRAEMHRELLLETVDALHEYADRVVLIAHPDVGEARIDGLPTGSSFSEYDPGRAERWREIIADVAADRPNVEVIDMAAWVDARDDDDWLRPDGVHFSSTSTLVVAEWLAPQLIAAATAPTDGL